MWVDSGLVVVVCIILSMVVSVFFILFYVQYEWCQVLFRNYTVSTQHYHIIWILRKYKGVIQLWHQHVLGMKSDTDISNVTTPPPSYDNFWRV